MISLLQEGPGPLTYGPESVTLLMEVVLNGKEIAGADLLPHVVALRDDFLLELTCLPRTGRGDAEGERVRAAFDAATKRLDFLALAVIQLAPLLGAHGLSGDFWTWVYGSNAWAEYKRVYDWLKSQDETDKARRAAYHARPEIKAKRKAHQATPEYREAHKARERARYAEKKKGSVGRTTEPGTNEEK